ncbi:MAG TPA: acetoin dehydrogenase dihydrolipoyllysine-residue acetyltransferase subunit [Vineibacter sp.]|nr:acetoin dehydrogenase dihydrolipoyllysine-residue acetyltransferase subunit [Vineibacter sp.]
MAGTITSVTMPKWGLTMTEGMVAKWMVAPGSVVKAGAEIMEIETTKITNVFESPAGGILRRQVAPEGATVPVGGLLAVLADEGVSEAEIDAFVAKFQAEFVPPADEVGAAAAGPVVIEAGGRRLRYLRMGADGGTPILFIHGFGADLGAWMFNQPALAERHATVALDLPGHGGSGKDVGAGDAATFVGAVADFMAAADIARAHLVGHSLGGALALGLSKAHPQCVASLTLIAPAGLGPDINMTFIEGFIRAGKRKEAKETLELLAADPKAISRAMIDEVLKYKRLDGVVPALTAIAAAAFPGGRQGSVLREALATAKVPRQVIWGHADRIIPASHAEGLPADVAVHVLDGAGHLPHMEKSGEVNRLIAALTAR